MTSTTLKTNHIKTQSNTHQRMLYLTSTALFTAMICITTAYIFHIPFGMNGGYIHIGDALIYMAAAILPAPYAMVAGALGGAFADLLTAPIWTPATFLIKMMITIPFTCKKDKIIHFQNVVAVFFAAFLSFIGYTVAEKILFGTWAAIIPSLIGSLMQSGSSAVLFIIFGLTLDKMHFKTIIRNKFKL